MNKMMYDSEKRTFLPEKKDRIFQKFRTRNIPHKNKICTDGAYFYLIKTSN